MVTFSASISLYATNQQTIIIMSFSVGSSANVDMALGKTVYSPAASTLIYFMALHSQSTTQIFTNAPQTINRESQTT